MAKSQDYRLVAWHMDGLTGLLVRFQHFYGGGIMLLDGLALGSESRVISSTLDMFMSWLVMRL